MLKAKSIINSKDSHYLIRQKNILILSTPVNTASKYMICILFSPKALILN